MGFSCRLQKPVKSKVTRFAPFSSITQAGFVQIVKADWNKAYFDELEIFNGDGKTKDDQVDATADAMYLLNKELIIPSMHLTDYSGSSSPFGFAPSFGSQSMEFPTF